MDDQAIIGILLWTVGVGLVAIRLTTKKIAVPALVVGTILVIMAIPPLDQRQYDAYTLGLLIIPVFFARFVYMAQAEQHGPIVGLGSPAFVGVVGAVLYMMTALYVTSAPNDTFREMAASEPYGPIAVTAPNQVVHVKVGGVPGPHRDTADVGLPPLTLTSAWRSYAIELGRADLSNVVGGFGVTVKRDENPKGCAFYLDEIRYEMAD